MCVIVVSNKKVDKVILEKCWDANPSGAGYSICTGDNVFFRRGIMKYKEFLDLYNQEVKENIWHTIHFRIPSAGDRGDVMTHPFPIDKAYLENLSDIVERNGKTFGFKIMHKQGKLKPDMKSGITQATLSHNGTMHSLGQGDLSDSFCAAYILSHIEDKSAYGKILKMISSTSNCFAITLSNGVNMIGDFIKKDDIYYSNMYWDRISITNYEWSNSNNSYFRQHGNIIRKQEDNEEELTKDNSIYCAILETVIDRKDCADCKDSTEYLCDTSNRGVFIYCPKEKIQVEVSTYCRDCELNDECFTQEQKLI